MISRIAVATASLLTLTIAALAQEPAPPPEPQAPPPPEAYTETIQVTATRIPEDVDAVPASIQVVTAQELRDRGATDLKSALSMAAGVDIAPGGDGGPAGYVPEFWGLKEFDAFLLVVDGVPWGGAFNPALATIDLNDVERIEVQRGPAAVMYGATSFVGVIQIVRRQPGETTGSVSLRGGSYSSYGAFVTTPLPSWAGFASSISADYATQGFEDDRTSFDKGHLLWRNRRAWGNQAFHFDIDVTDVDQEPASPTPRVGSELTTLVPIDSNQNPDGAHLDETRIFLNLGHEVALSFGQWATSLAYTDSRQDQLRGFLTDVAAPFPNAAGFRADIDVTDLYLDTHGSWTKATRWKAVVGFDYLYGEAKADGDTFLYNANLDGSNPAENIPEGMARGIEDKRNFAGLYGNLEWTPAAAWRIEAGARLNHVEEEREEADPAAPPVAGEEEEKLDEFRPSGGVGVTFTPWQGEGSRFSVFANWKNTFKPAAIDSNLAESGSEEGILDPETSNSYELGVKTELLDHALRLELASFLMDFDNLVVSQVVGGLPALENAGSSRLKGIEFSSVWTALPHLTTQLSYSYHDARFSDYLTEFGGVPTQLSGNRLEMSPHDLAAVAISWAPEGGVFASAEASYVGSRFLNKRNTAPADAYTTVAAMVGFRAGKWEVQVAGRNLTDVRDPVAESELGDAQYYLLFPRRYDASFTLRF